MQRGDNAEQNAGRYADEQRKNSQREQNFFKSVSEQWRSPFRPQNPSHNT